jgi:hypothetical protein
LFLAGIRFYDFILPKALPIELPAIDKISMIQISKNNIKYEYTDRESIQKIIDVFLNAKRTRRLTVKDESVKNGYYTAKFISVDDKRDSYIYREGLKWYIEQPYHGVYEIKEEKLAFIDINTQNE